MSYLKFIKMVFGNLSGVQIVSFVASREFSVRHGE